MVFRAVFPLTQRAWVLEVILFPGLYGSMFINISQCSFLTVLYLCDVASQYCPENKHIIIFRFVFILKPKNKAWSPISLLSYILKHM